MVLAVKREELNCEQEERDLSAAADNWQNWSGRITGGWQRQFAAQTLKRTRMRLFELVLPYHQRTQGDGEATLEILTENFQEKWFLLNTSFILLKVMPCGCKDILLFCTIPFELFSFSCQCNFVLMENGSWPSSSSDTTGHTRFCQWWLAPCAGE